MMLTTALSSYLPPEFPNMAPILTIVKPQLQHRIIRKNDPQQTLTGHEKLRDWQPHASLAKIVKELEQALVLQPPVLLSPEPAAAAAAGSGATPQGATNPRPTAVTPPYPNSVLSPPSMPPKPAAMQTG